MARPDGLAIGRLVEMPWTSRRPFRQVRGVVLELSVVIQGVAPYLASIAWRAAGSASTSSRLSWSSIFLCTKAQQKEPETQRSSLTDLRLVSPNPADHTRR